VKPRWSRWRGAARSGARFSDAVVYGCSATTACVRTKTPRHRGCPRRSWRPAHSRPNSRCYAATGRQWPLRSGCPRLPTRRRKARGRSRSTTWRRARLSTPGRCSPGTACGRLGSLRRVTSAADGCLPAMSCGWCAFGQSSCRPRPGKPLRRLTADGGGSSVVRSRSCVLPWERLKPSCVRAYRHARTRRYGP